MKPDVTFPKSIPEMITARNLDSQRRAIDSLLPVLQGLATALNLEYAEYIRIRDSILDLSLEWTILHFLWEDSMVE